MPAKSAAQQAEAWHAEMAEDQRPERANREPGGKREQRAGQQDQTAHKMSCCRSLL